MPTLTSEKVQGFLASPHTYPRGGLGFGSNAGAQSAMRPDGPRNTNKMNAAGTTFKMPAATSSNVNREMQANFHAKSAELKDIGMIEKIKQLALEKCAGDEQKAREFLEGFFDEVLEKSAAFGAGKHLTPGEELVSNFTGSIGKGLAGLAMGMGVTSIASAFKGVQNDRLHTQFVEALKTAISSNPILRQAKKEKVVNYANTIFKFAPHVATDANLLSSILANAIHGEGIDPMTIRTLTDLESRYSDTTSVNSFSPKSYV